ncbi:hypothetical protein GL263_03970 [Streptomyces durbertensis]|uniref:AraC-type arabinose-binding/dimerisation domain-containing protein n=1 Tax=Streptomyces durbertensis TaxID=2448886 RepID=A0ABR6EBN4_9ACTN|nr:hypothetical protein [Streptomyces durbertensis]MBB1242734.1 hypothetical protein [Streptomyces durbertensis]
MSDAHTPAAGQGPAGAGAPQVVCDTAALAATAAARGGALWRLTEPGRQLDANLVRIRPGEAVPAHVERDLDVLALVVAGDGTLGTEPAPQPLTPGSLVWLPHGAARSLTAGVNGMTYLTVHRRRPGMRIQPRPGP